MKIVAGEGKEERNFWRSSGGGVQRRTQGSVAKVVANLGQNGLGSKCFGFECSGFGLRMRCAGAKNEDREFEKQKKRKHHLFDFGQFRLRCRGSGGTSRTSRRCSTKGRRSLCCSAALPERRHHDSWRVDGHSRGSLPAPLTSQAC